LNSSWKFFVSGLVNSNVNINCSSSVLNFSNLMHILKDFYNLRHKNDFLHYFFKNERNFNEFFFSDTHLDWNVFDSINDFQNFLDVIDISDDLLKLLSINNFLY